MEKKRMTMTYLGRDSKHRECFEVENGCYLCDVSRQFLLTNGAKSKLYIMLDNTEWFKTEPYCPVDPNIDFVAKPHSWILGASAIQYGVDEQFRHYVYNPHNGHTDYFDNMKAAENAANTLCGKWLRMGNDSRQKFNRQIAMD